MNITIELPLSLVVKLGAIAVHADEYTSPKGSPVDAEAIKSLMQDQEVQKWITTMGALLPLKR